MAVCRLAQCAVFYSWVVDFKKEVRRLTFITDTIGRSATACYNLGALLGVQFYSGPSVLRTHNKNPCKEFEKMT